MYTLLRLYYKNGRVWAQIIFDGLEFVRKDKHLED